MKKVSHRSRARRLALQALYAWQITENSLSQVEADFLSAVDLFDEEEQAAVRPFDANYFKVLLHAIPKHCDELDEAIVPYLDRPLAELDAVTLTILRIGAYELTHCLDIPYRVVINEAVELAKLFTAREAHRFVNGVLDKAAQAIRATETA